MWFVKNIYDIRPIMSLSATRCVFHHIICGKSTIPVSMNIVTFMTLQCHNVQLKCLQTQFAIVSKKAPVYFTSKRCLNLTTTLRISRNFYDVLGVPRNANQKEIKNAYYKLAMKHHPDKNQGNLTQQFREIKEAYDVLSNESSRMKYDNSNSNYKNTSSEWSSNSSYERYKPYEEYKWTNSRTEYRRPKRDRYYNYSNLKPYNVFINVIKVPKNIVKAQIDIMLLTFIKNRALKLILFQIFQFLWSQVLKNLNFNVLISSTSNNGLEGFIRSILGNNTIRIELTEMESLKGKAVRLHVNDNEKVLVVNIPKGVKRDQSFFLFYLVDDDDNNQHSFKA